VLTILKAGKDLLTMRVGALVDPILLENLKSLATQMRRKVYVPSGAIARLDGTRVTAVGKITETILTSIKPPEPLSFHPTSNPKGSVLKRLKNRPWYTKAQLLRHVNSSQPM